MLTEGALAEYTTSRAVANNTSLLILEEKVPQIPGKKKFNLSTIGEGFSLAIGFLRRKPDEAAASAQLARSKRRGKLLDNLNDEDVAEASQSFGSMMDVDRELSREPDER
jgi:hypothetical protein